MVNIFIEASLKFFVISMFTERDELKWIGESD